MRLMSAAFLSSSPPICDDGPDAGGGEGTCRVPLGQRDQFGHGPRKVRAHRQHVRRRIGDQADQRKSRKKSYGSFFEMILVDDHGAGRLNTIVLAAGGGARGLSLVPDDAAGAVAVQHHHGLAHQVRQVLA